VVNIAAEEIEPPPSFGVDVPTDFLLGIGKSQGRVKMLLDIDHVLTGTEIVQAASAVGDSASGVDASTAT
jgi:purine-binding chemotaxis protein CheW